MQRGVGSVLRNPYFMIPRSQLSIFSYPFARLIWRVVHFTFNILPLTNVTNMVGNFLNMIDKKTKAQIHVGVLFLVLCLLNCLSDVFNNVGITHFCRLYT